MGHIDILIYLNKYVFIYYHIDILICNVLIHQYINTFISMGWGMLTIQFRALILVAKQVI